MKKMIPNAPFSPVILNNRFYNYNGTECLEEPESLIPSIKMYFGSFRNFCKKPLHKEKWIDKPSVVSRSTGTVVTWLGHATMLIQVDNLNILVDPLFDTPSTVYRRILPFGMSKDTLPHIDLVMLSHNHRDHMDTKSILYLHKMFNPLFLVPQGDKNWFLKRNISSVEQFTWWEQITHENVTFSFVPAWHWSQRGLFDHNKSLWGGWVIESSRDTIYFAGDTAYNEMYFESIGEMFPSLNIAIMPIGPGSPDEWMKRSHMNAETAGKAFLDCNASIFIPMHWGTFYFGHDLFDTPILRLQKWWDTSEDIIHDKILKIGKIGESLRF